VRKRRETKNPQRVTPGTAEETREALDFCFEDVSSLRMVGAAPLNDLMASTSPQPGATNASPAARGGHRWNLLVLALLVLMAAAVTAVTLLH
jgi:hypothetical protein